MASDEPTATAAGARPAAVHGRRQGGAGPLAFGAETWTRFIVIGTMCMAQSFPYAFIASGVPAVFRVQGLALEDFWIFSLPVIPFWLKFVWAPLVDRHGWTRLGLRKSWILPCTLAGAASVAVIGFIEPSLQTLYPIAILLFLHALIMGTQDIAVDAYTLENLAPAERAAGSGVKVFFEAAGEFLALAGLLFVYDRCGWSWALPAAGVLLVLFTLPAMIRREPVPPSRALAVRPSLFGFARRRDSLPVGALLVAGGVANGAMPPLLGAFLVDKGFSLAEVGVITGTVMSVATLSGVGLAALVITGMGLRRAVLAQAAFAALAFLPIAAFTATAAPGVALAIAAVFPASMALAQLHLVFTVSRMGWASASQAGTDFTIHGAFYNIGRTLAAAAVGFVAAAFGWAGFFLALAAVIVGICAVYAAGFAALTRAVEAREARLALRPNEATS